MAIIRQKSTRDTRPDIEFCEYKRNDFVLMFLEILAADIQEHERCQQMYDVHRAIASDHDLYFAVWDCLSWHQQQAIRECVVRQGFMWPPDSFCGKRLCDGDVCCMTKDHSGECMALPI